MNLIAIDIGNTNVNIGLFLDGEQKFIESIPGDSLDQLTECIQKAWEQIPVLESSAEGRRDGRLVVSSVKSEWTDEIRTIAAKKLDETVLVVGQDIPLPMPVWLDSPDKVGTDRVISAAAAHEVVGDAVIVIDFGTALTIDLVDANGVFRGGVICPGFEMSARALHNSTAQLPEIEVTKPEGPFGTNTESAINCGLYYAAVSTIQEVIRRYAEEIGKWPQTVITGAATQTIRDDCEFVDSWVPNLVVKGIALAYRHFIEQRAETG